MLLKVISNKTLGYDKPTVLKLVMTDETKEHFLYRVFGVIEGHQIGKGRHKRVDKETGEAVDTTWTKFFGDFIALKTDGRQFEASTVFLPEYVSGQFVSHLTGSNGDDGAALAIEFAYDIFARYNKDAATSYEYIAQAVRKEGEARKATAMASKFAALPKSASAPAIEAPKEGKKKEK